MASTNPTTRTSPSNTTRILRKICFWTFIPALGFNLGHGIAYGCLLPILGIIPHFSSSLLATIELGWWEKLFRPKHRYHIVLSDDLYEEDDGKPSSLRVTIIAVADTVIGLSLLGCIVGSYIVISDRMNRWYYSEVGIAIVGTYGTLPFIVNALIHGFFLLKALRDASRRCMTPKLSTCPHCRNALSALSAPAQTQIQTQNIVPDTASETGSQASSQTVARAAERTV